MSQMKIRYIGLTIVAFSLIVGCGSGGKKKEQMSESLTRGMRLEVALDSMQSGLEIVGSGKDPERLKRHTIVKYINSIRCTSCVVKNLRYWIAFQDFLDEYRKELSLVIVIAPRKYQQRVVCEELAKDTIMLENVYIDSLGIFERMNPQIRQGDPMSCYLIDEKHRIQIVGDPTCDGTVEQELVEYMERNAKEHEK